MCHTRSMTCETPSLYDLKPLISDQRPPITPTSLQFLSESLLVYSDVLTETDHLSPLHGTIFQIVDHKFQITCHIFHNLPKKFNEFEIHFLMSSEED